MQGRQKKIEKNTVAWFLGDLLKWPPFIGTKRGLGGWASMCKLMCKSSHLEVWSKLASSNQLWDLINIIILCKRCGTHCTGVDHELDVGPLYACPPLTKDVPKPYRWPQYFVSSMLSSKNSCKRSASLDEIRAVDTRKNKPRITQSAAYVSRELLI